MGKDAVTTLRELSENVEFTQSFLRKAKRAITTGEKAVAVLDETIKASDKEAVANAALQTAIEEVIANDLEDVYSSELDEAIRKSPEYSSDYYYVGLRNLVYSANLCSVTVTGGTGFAKTVDVKLRMNEVAGDISDWAGAIESTRAALKVRDNRDPVKSSEFWKKSVFGTALYDSTMQSRLGYVSYPAPYWSLLEYGNVNTGMESDIGGTPYPKHARSTRFVKKTEDQVKKLILSKFKEARANYEGWIEGLQYDRNNLLYEINNIRGAVNRVSENLLLSRQIAREYSRSIDDIDAGKFDKALELAREGYTGRVDIGKRGKPRFRASLGKLYGL